jgi:hypothetical protein
MLAGCSRAHQSAPPAPTDAAKAAAPPTARVVDAGLPVDARRDDPPRDYRGTLGQRTSIVMHLDRSRGSIAGFYRYGDVGEAIQLTGSVDATGALSLAEAGGTMRLRPEGDGLVGEWASATRDKVFPVRLSPGPPWNLVLPDAGTAPGARAETCLADPRCPASEADRLFVAADDAREQGVDCFRFLDGAGTRKDLTRGRACLERSVGTSKCEQSSPDLDRAALATMLLRGIGGARDTARVRALLADCYADLTTQGLLLEADGKSTPDAKPQAASETFCEGLFGTTLTGNECMLHRRTLEETRVALAAKRVALGLDAPAVRLLMDASRAYAAYTSAMGRFVYEVYIEGSLRNQQALGTELALMASRAKTLRELDHFVAPETSAEAVTRAEATAAAALAAVPRSTAGERSELAKAEDAWAAYRDAEKRFLVQAFGAKQGREKVERAARALLAEKRAKDCEALTNRQ